MRSSPSGRTTARLPSSENDVKEIIKKWVEYHGGYSVAIAAGNGMGVHGIPDRIGVIPVEITQAMVGKTIGVAVTIEAKKPGRRGEKNAGATAAQRDHLLEFARRGAISALVDCEFDLDLIGSHLKKLQDRPAIELIELVMKQLYERLSGNE